MSRTVIVNSIIQNLYMLFITSFTNLGFVLSQNKNGHNFSFTEIQLIVLPTEVPLVLAEKNNM
jgi:hypothetical protein